MSKLWQKFKYWLIKKLGGCCVENRIIHNDRAIVIYADVLIPTERLGAPIRFDYQSCRRLDDLDIALMIKTNLAKQLAVKIVESDLFDIQRSDDYFRSETLFRAIVRVLPPESNYRNKRGIGECKK